MVSVDHKYTAFIANHAITAVVTIITVKDNKLGRLLCILHNIYLQPAGSVPNTWYSSVIPNCPSSTRLSFKMQASLVNSSMHCNVITEVMLTFLLTKIFLHRSSLDYATK